MTTAVRQQLPPTATVVTDIDDYGTDFADPFALIAHGADLVMVNVLKDDFDGYMDVDDELTSDDVFLLDSITFDLPEPPVDWEDYTTDDYRWFVGL